MLNWNIQGCTEHGRLACHINRDGRHIDPEWCTCERDPRMCPVDLHATAAPMAAVAERIASTPVKTRFDNWALRNAKQIPLGGAR